MVRTFINIVFLLLLIPAGVAGKSSKPEREPPKWVNDVLRKEMYPDTIYFVQFERVNNVKRKDFDVIQKEVVRRLRERLSKQIQSFISTKSLLVQTESNKYGYNEYFAKETKIRSDVDLFDSKPVIWYDKRGRKLFVLYAIKKTELGKKYLNIYESRLTTLKKELDTYNADVSLSLLQMDIDNFEKRVEELKRIESIIAATGIKIPDESTTVYSGINNKINELRSKLHSAAVEKRIHNAEELFADSRYEEALKEFRMLSVDLPNDIRVMRGIKESKTAIEQTYLHKIDRAVKRSRFEYALELFDMLFKILPETRKEHVSEINELEHKMFDHLSAELDIALKSGDVSKIKTAYNELENFKFIDTEKVKGYKEKVDRATAENYYREARYSYSQHNYRDAVSRVKKAIVLDRSNNKYKDLYNASKDKIYRHDLRQLKATRHHVMMIRFGGGVQTHKEFASQLIDDKDSKAVWLPSFSAGLFAKYGIRSHVTAYGNDLSRSNIVGFQYTFIQPEWNFGKGDMPRKELSYWQEVEFVMGFATKWLFETGFANNRLSTSIDLKKVNFYTAALTRRFYTHPMELTMQLKTYVSPGWDFYPVFKIGLYFDVNLIRKISRADKKRIKQEISVIR